MEDGYQMEEQAIKFEEKWRNRKTKDNSEN